MRIEKKQVIDILRNRCQDGAACEAEQELPTTVDSEQDADVLGTLGIHPDDLTSRSRDGQGG